MPHLEYPGEDFLCPIKVNIVNKVMNKEMKDTSKKVPIWHLYFTPEVMQYGN